jgi:hypothetical protein
MGSPLPTSASGRGAPPPQYPLVLLVVLLLATMVVMGSASMICFPLFFSESNYEPGSVIFL